MSKATRLCHFGYLLLGKGELVEALSQFNDAIQSQPDSFEAWLGKARVLQRAKRYPAALRCFEKAVQLRSVPDVRLMLEQARLLIQLKWLHRALDCCEKALALSPSSIQGRWLRLKILWRLGRYQEVGQSLRPNLRLKLREPQLVSSQVPVISSELP